MMRTSLTLFSYMEHVCSIIAKAQITNGGPVILFQPENEYSAGDGVPFPSHEYLKYVNDQARNAGIVVPLINNDAWQGGTGAPGSGIGAVDIYVSLWPDRCIRLSDSRRDMMVILRDSTV